MSEETHSQDFNLDVKEAVDVLRRGGIVLYPTDTVWGIGCDACNPSAVKRIYELKQRDESKSMLVLVSSEAMLEQCVETVPAIAWDLIDVAVRPLTIIYDGARGVASELIAPDGSLGIRLTKEAYSRALCSRLGRPIVSTSANISGVTAPALFSEICQEITVGVDYVARYRRDDRHAIAPSDIIRLHENGEFNIIR